MVTRPFAGQVDPQNPVTMTPFTQQPFTQQTGILNPFTQQPFTQQTTVYDVIDFTFPVTLAGDQAAAASALLAVQNAQQLTGSYLFQVIISRVSLTPATNGCSSIDTVQELQVSNIRAPFTQQPFTQQPFTQQPFTQQPFTQQPFTQQPFTQQPFTQQSDPRDPVVSTSTFYLAPSPTPDQTAGLRGADRVLARGSSDARLTPVRLQTTPPGPDDYRADRADLGLTYTLRAFQIAANPPVRILDPVTGQANVGVSVATDTPEIVVIDGTPRFNPAGPPVSSGGAAFRCRAGLARLLDTRRPEAIAVIGIGGLVAARLADGSSSRSDRLGVGRRGYSPGDEAQAGCRSARVRRRGAGSADVTSRSATSPSWTRRVASVARNISIASTPSGRENR